MRFFILPCLVYNERRATRPPVLDVMTRLTVVALAVGLVGGVAGYALLGSAIYAHALTLPGWGEWNQPRLTWGSRARKR